MRIPLDYYRILGLPIQATAEQLQQAHRDRTLQLPRREYSEAAIAARKQLLDEAYEILSNPDQRQTYDAGFLAKSYDLEPERLSESPAMSAASTLADAADAAPDPYTPSIEIQTQQLVGALLILLELGEYELVLKLGRPYLSSGSVSLKNGRFGEPDIVLADIVITIALACLELGREQWQQGQYENAAESLETGQELLLREGLFASLRGEMQADLYKLRPYRILELLALPIGNAAERRQGLSLLEDMLQDRGGIDGTGDDQSGLNVDDFLRFIQQLRDYLTAEEQQVLFEREARRPSAVATYLAVYALIARGFAQRQPALIRRAKLMLIRLGARQDVHLEQAVCALLLGQTEEASRALELSHEYDSLAFIREHSQGAPDLLPGLCLYGESWLQNEVFPHFRDLAHQQASLKEYFADEQVQAYLEELPNEPEASNQWSVVQSTAIAPQPGAAQPVRGSVREINSTPEPRSPGVSAARVAPAAATATVDAVGGYTTPNGSSQNATKNATNGVSTLPTAARISQLSPEGRLASADAATRGPHPQATDRSGPGMRVADTPLAPPHRATTGRNAPKIGRLLLVALLGLLSLGALAFVVSRAYGWLSRSMSGPVLQGEQLQIQLDQPPIAIPDPTATPESATAATGPLTEENARALIQTWLSTKAQAMGPEHQADQLPNILTDPALSQWRGWSQAAQRNEAHAQYEHRIGDVSVVSAGETSEQAQIEANVSETARFFDAAGQENVSESYSSDLRVRYDLIRQEGQWRIREMTVL